MPTAAVLLLPLLVLAAACARGGSAAGDGVEASAVGTAPIERIERIERAEPPASGAPTPAPAPRGTLTPAEPEMACAEPPCYAEPQLVGRFDPAIVPEASGLAVSARDPELLYLLDDGPGTAEVWVVRRDGEMLGPIRVEGMDGLDTESLAVGPCGSGAAGSCVYVGDIGDNRRRRDHVTVHRFPEPDLAAGVPDAVSAEAIRLRYPDERHDAEALLVGPEGTPHIVTKATFDRESGSTGSTHVYRAPGFADGTLEHLGELVLPAPQAPMQSAVVGNVVTGGEAADGHAVLRTYDQVLSLRGEDLGALPSWEVRQVPSPFELQSEAIALDADGCSYLTVGEQAGDIWFVECHR